MQLRNSNMLMEKSNLYPTLLQLVRTFRQFELYLSRDIHEFGKEYAEGHGTVSSSKTGIPARFLAEQNKGEQGEDFEVKVEPEQQREKRTYLFDCLLKAVFLVVDGVLEDREKFAEEETKRLYRHIDVMEKKQEKT